MDAVTLTASQSPQKPFWLHILKPKIFTISFVVWVSLICQDFYAYVFNWSLLNNVKIFYLTKWAITLLLIYGLFLFINFLINLTTFKRLFYKKIFLIVLIVWSVMNLSCYQLLFFDYVSNIKVYVLKLFHLFALYALVLTITKLFQYRHESRVKHQLFLFLIFCAIGWLFLLLTYPGAWSCDDIIILDHCASYYLFPWQHIFSSMFYILCLQTIPFVFSVIFFQVFINALIFSYCVTTLADIFTKTSRQKLVLEIILSILFIFPPVLFHTLGGFRMGIYQFLELYLLTKLIALYHYKENKLSLLNLIDITILTIVVGTWRTECFFYPFIVLFVLFFLGKDRIKRTTALIMAFISCVSILSINRLNTFLNNNNNYTVCTTMPIVCKILLEVNDLDTNTIAMLDKVIDVNQIKSQPEKTLQEYFWTDGCVRNWYSQAEYEEYMKTALKLYFTYPEKAFNYLSTNFQRTLFGYNLTLQLQNSIYAFSNPDYQNYWYNFETITDNFLHKPINTKFRNDVINWLNGFSVNYDFVYPYCKITPFYSISYNLAIPLCLFLISIIIVLIRRRWFLLIPCMAIICHIAIVFFTAPEYYFFYYLSVYLFMYAFSFIILFNGITDLINKIKEKHQSKLKTQ